MTIVQDSVEHLKLFRSFEIIEMATAYTEQARQKEKLEEVLQNVRKGEFCKISLTKADQFLFLHKDVEKFFSPN